MIHELKTWPEPFKGIALRRKTYEVRVFDRPFEFGDFVILREFNPEYGKNYLGPFILVQIKYVTKPGEWGLPSGHVGVFGFEVIESGNGDAALEACRKALTL